MKRSEPCLALLVLACLVIFPSGCKHGSQPNKVVLGTAAHHVRTGNTFVQTGKLNDALREFQIARELEPDFASAYVGLAVLASFEGDCLTAMDRLREAESVANDDADNLEVRTGRIRVYAACGDKLNTGWLALAEKEYEQAKQMSRQNTPLAYHMGVAYKNACNFSRAKVFFDQVRDYSTDRILNAKAKQDLAHMKNIEQAGPKTIQGKKIALQAAISRAELCFFLARELDGMGMTASPNTSEDAKDVAGHSFQEEVVAIMASHIDGLELDPNHAFQPDAIVSRCQFAKIMAGILRNRLGDTFSGVTLPDGHSPFPDVADDADCLESLAISTEYGFLETKDRKTRNIEPAGPVSGVDALRGIRALERQLRKAG